MTAPTPPTTKLFNLYSFQSPPPSEPLHQHQTLAMAKQILSTHAYNRLDDLAVGDMMTTFAGYIWERTA